MSTQHEHVRESFMRVWKSADPGSDQEGTAKPLMHCTAGMLKRLVVSIVEFSARARWLVLAIAVVLAAYSAVVVGRHFAIDTNINNLISQNLPWRQHQAAYLKAFPSQETVILAVIDAPTPELAQNAAAKLSKATKFGTRKTSTAPLFSGETACFIFPTKSFPRP